jgi:hypothetical protein
VQFENSRSRVLRVFAELFNAVIYFSGVANVSLACETVIALALSRRDRRNPKNSFMPAPDFADTFKTVIPGRTD